MKIFYQITKDILLKGVRKHITIGYERFKKESLQPVFLFLDYSNILGQVTVTYWAKFNTKVFLICGSDLGNIFDNTCKKLLF